MFLRQGCSEPSSSLITRLGKQDGMPYGLSRSQVVNLMINGIFESFFRAILARRKFFDFFRFDEFFVFPFFTMIFDHFRLGPLSNYPHSCDHYPIGTCHQDEVYDPNILVAPNRQTELALLKQEIDSKTLHEIITRILEREHFINGDNSMSMEEDLSSGYSSLKSSPNSSNYRYQPEQVGFQPLVIHRSSSPRIQELPFRPLHNESPRVVSATRAMFRNQLEEPMMHHQSLRLNRNYGSGRFSRKPVITALV